MVRTESSRATRRYRYTPRYLGLISLALAHLPQVLISPLRDHLPCSSNFTLHRRIPWKIQFMHFGSGAGSAPAVGRREGRTSLSNHNFGSGSHMAQRPLSSRFTASYCVLRNLRRVTYAGGVEQRTHNRTILIRSRSEDQSAYAFDYLDPASDLDPPWYYQTYDYLAAAGR